MRPLLKVLLASPCSLHISGYVRACPAGTYLCAGCEWWVCVMVDADCVGRERPVREERQACNHVAKQRLAGSLAAACTSVCALPARSCPLWVCVIDA